MIGCGSIRLPAAAADLQASCSIVVSGRCKSVDGLIACRLNRADQSKLGIVSRAMEQMITIGFELSPVNGYGCVRGCIVRQLVHRGV